MASLAGGPHLPPLLPARGQPVGAGGLVVVGAAFYRFLPSGLEQRPPEGAWVISRVDPGSDPRCVDCGCRVPADLYPVLQSVPPGFFARSLSPLFVRSFISKAFTEHLLYARPWAVNKAVTSSLQPHVWDSRARHQPLPGREFSSVGVGFPERMGEPAGFRAGVV